MSDSLQKDRVYKTPLPFSLVFSSKLLRLEELLSQQEKKYRNRPYKLKKLEGETALMLLGNIPIAKVVVAGEGTTLKIKSKGIKENIAKALEEGDLTIAASAGRAVIPKESLSTLKMGDIILLECDIQYTMPLILPEIDYILGFGETVSLDSAVFGSRITSLEGGPRIKPSNTEGITGEVLLGSMVMPPENLNSIGDGTILKLSAPLTPHKFILSDATEITGYLQCYEKEELRKNRRLINKIPPIEGNIVLGFYVTSNGDLGGKDPGRENSANKVTVQNEAAEISTNAVLSLLPAKRVLGILAGMDSLMAAWFLKSIDPDEAAKYILSLTIDKGEEAGAAFLDSFIQCRPDITPATVRKTFNQFFMDFLDEDEKKAAYEYYEQMGEKRIPQKDPFQAAAEVVNRLDEKEQRVLLQWLEIYTHSYEKIKTYIFLFEDIASLTDIQMQQLLREIDMKYLCNSLTGEEEFLGSLKEKIMKNMSKRAREVFAEELSYAVNIREKERLNSRSHILQILIRMEENGSIVIG